MTNEVRRELVDVVVPVRSAEGSEYEKLVLCCKAIRQRIPVNRLIIPTANQSEKTRRRIAELADLPVFDETAVGAGLCRNIGLREVETEYYASIDADTAVREGWYPWCINSIRQPKVAACQGYSKPVSRLLDRFVKIEALDVGTYADLGNTLLRTAVVRKVGMPIEPMMEDHLLHDRLTRRGYQWIVNRELISDHLLNELDVLRHRYWYGRFAPQSFSMVVRYSVWLAHETVVRRHRRFGTRVSLFLMMADLATATGSFTGYYVGREDLN